MMGVVVVGLVFNIVVPLAWSQSVHMVQVGQFFIPPTISALEGDVVQFLFTAGNHGVTQAVGISDPCSQLPGGFNSGVVSGFAANDTNASPTWSLMITNASEPIFFYCAATVPSFHCASGMVGAINAEPDQYSSYSVAAKSVTGTPVQTTSVALTGVGAVATAVPFTPTPSSLPGSSTLTSSFDVPSSVATLSSSALPSETSASSSGTSSSRAAAIGGGIGGGIAFSIVSLLGFMLYREREKHRKNTSTTDIIISSDEKIDRTGDPSTPPGLGGTRFNSVHKIDPFTSATNLPSPRFTSNQIGDPGNLENAEARYLSPYPHSVMHTRGSPAFTSPRPGPSSGSIPGQEYMLARTMANSQTVPFYSQTRYPTPTQGSNMNVHEIAKEVASLLGPQLRTANAPISVSPPTGGRALPVPRFQIDNDDTVPKSPGPPGYQQYEMN